MPRKENAYAPLLIERLLNQYPGAIILKQDPNLVQGIPDRLMLWEDRWASFEIKRDRYAPVQPNQPYYIDLLNRMSYASFVYPENEEQFFYELEYAFRSR